MHSTWRDLVLFAVRADIYRALTSVVRINEPLRGVLDRVAVETDERAAELGRAAQPGDRLPARTGGQR
jgi:hypothetical protein